MDDKRRSFLKENGINADAALEFMDGQRKNVREVSLSFYGRSDLSGAFFFNSKSSAEKRRGLLRIL